MFDIIGRRRYGYILSAIFVSVGLLFILATLIPQGNVGLQFSIAYTGGTVWEVHFEEGTPTPNEVRTVLAEQGLPNSEVAITGADDREYVLIRTEALTLIEAESAADGTTEEPPELEPLPTSAELAASPGATDSGLGALPGAGAGLTGAGGPGGATDPAGLRGLPGAGAGLAEPADGDGVAGVPTEGEFGELATALQERFGPIDEVRQQNSVGPVVSSELVQQTFLLIVFAALAIMGWITYRFRDFRMGVTAVVALVHDVIVTVGAFALLGTFFGLEVDALFVTAMLTVIGFSVHDTIVVFDRVRENRQRYLGEPLEAIVSHSISQTLGRSITTSLTLVLTLLALLVFGGDAIRPFTLVLLIGVVAGTYSSIFVATPLFLDWHLREDRRKAQQRISQPRTA